MPRGFPTRSVTLLLVCLLAWPAAGRVVMQCADGSPCPMAPVVVEKAQDCCQPKPWHVALEKRCVIETTPAPLRVRAEAGPVVAPLALLAIRSSVTILVPPTPVVTPALDQERPPDQPPPKQGRAPRAPPAHHA